MQVILKRDEYLVMEILEVEKKMKKGWQSRRGQKEWKKEKYLRNIVDGRHWSEEITGLKAWLAGVESRLGPGGMWVSNFWLKIALEGNPSF